MKIIQVIKNFPPVIGGAENYVYNLSRQLALRGHDVTVLTMKLPNTLRLEKRTGLKIRRCSLLELIPILTKLRGDVIHIHQYGFYHIDVAAIIASRRRIPIVLTLHGVYPHETRDLARAIYFKFHKRTLGLLTLKNASKIIILTKDERSKIIRLGASYNKLVTIPNAIDISEFENFNRQLADDFRKQYGIDGKMILYVGHLTWNKRVEDAIEAFKMIETNFPSTKFVIAGEDWGTGRKLKALTHTLNLDDQVTFTGFLEREDLIAAYFAADVCIMPSMYEGMPTNVLEYMAAGKPIVATASEGTRNLIVNEKTGLLTDVGDVKQLSNSITRLFNNEVFARELGRNALQYVRAFHRWEEVALRIEELYKSAIKDKVCTGN